MRVPVSYTGAVPDDVLPLLRAVAYNTHWKCELSHLHCISFSVSGKPNLDQDILEALCVCDKARARVSYAGSVIEESERWEVNAAYQALQLLPEIDARAAIKTSLISYCCGIMLPSARWALSST